VFHDSSGCKAEPIEPMTLGNMRANGVQSLDVYCWVCHDAQRWRASGYRAKEPIVTDSRGNTAAPPVSNAANPGWCSTGRLVSVRLVMPANFEGGSGMSS
jgi:hypothetical protein